jgi:hypothetical protein
MARKTQGTVLFALLPTVADPTKMEVVRFAKVTTVNLGSDKRSDIDTTDLDQLENTTSVAGLSTSGEAALTINTDPKDPIQLRMYKLFQSGETVDFALGWGGSQDLPTVNTTFDGFLDPLPTTRTWSLFSGYISDFPFDTQGNAVFKSAVTIKRTTGVTWLPESA